MRIDNTGRECLYVTREHDVEAGGAHPSKSAKGEAAGFGVVQRWASPQRVLQRDKKSKGANRSMKIAFSLFSVLLIAVVVICLTLKMLFGVHFHVGRPRMRAHLPTKNKQQQAPLGLVRVIVPGSPASAVTDSVGIHAFNEIYAAIGVTQEEFAEWENRHGMDSAGVDEAGNMLASGYPVLSRVAWMYIDPV